MRYLTKIILACFVFFTPFVNADEKVNLQLMWKHQFQFAGYYMAKEKGFYKKKELDVNIKEYHSNINVTDEVVSNKADFGIGRSSLIQDKLEGKPVVLLASIFQHSPVVLLSKKRDDLKTIRDIKDKKVMLTNDHVGLASINAMLLSYGIKQNMYKTQSHSFNIDDLISGKTDLMLSYISNEPFALENKGVAYNIFSPTEHEFDFYSDILFTSQEFTSKNKQLTKDFKEASLEGWNYAIDNIDETIDLILEKYNTQNKTKQALLFEAKAMIKLIDQKSKTLGDIDNDKIKKIAQIYRLMGLTTKNNSIDNIIFNERKTINSKKEINKTFYIDSFISKISPVISSPLYNVDTENLPQLLKSYLKENKNVEAIELIESLDKEIVFQFYKDKENMVFNKILPKKSKNFKSISKKIYFNDEEVGVLTVYYRGNSINIGLTQEEKNWIKTHTVKVGVEQWAPVVFSNDGKDIDGISGDFTKKIINNTGLKVEIINDNWDKLLTDFEAKKLDILPATYYTNKRAKFGLYSDGYFAMKDYIYVKDTTTNINSLEDLNGKTLAIPKGYGTIDKVIKKFPNIKIILTKDLDDSIFRVLNGKVDALYDGQIAVEKKIKDELLTGLKGIAQNSFKAAKLHYFSKIDEPILQSILQKGLSSIAFEQRNKIIEKWVPNSNNLDFTYDELKWLDKKEPIKYVYDPDWAPFEWKNALGEHSGIIADILKIIENKTDIEFVATQTNTWADAVKLAENKKVDMYSAVVQNSNREKYMNFTSKDIYSYPAVFVTKSDDISTYFDIKKDLKSKRIGITKGNALGEYIKNKYPEFTYIDIKSTKDGFDKVDNGKIDVFAVNGATAVYFIKRKGYEDIKIANKFDFMFGLKIAISKDMPKEVISILDKAIYSLSDQEIDDIYYKWTEVNIEQKIDWVLVSEISAGIFILILFILWNNHKLKNKVKEKTADIEKQKDELENLSKNLEKKVEIQTKDLRKQLRVVKIAERKQEQLFVELNDERNFINTIMNSQENFVITSDGKCLKTANKAFYNFYNVQNIEEFMEKFGACICDTFDIDAPKEYIQKVMGDEKWLTYVNNRPNQIHKVLIKKDDKDYIFTVTSEKLEIAGQELKTAIFTDVTFMEKSKKEIEEIHKHTRESIEYASLIQSALIPDNNLFRNYFKDYFAIWHPKDIVGGDIYLFEELRDKDECLLMVIDCTGHGVPGAFVTMLVKAIERTIIADINNSNKEVNTSDILSIFNKSMKQLLKQNDKSSISNAGFDGQILYYNKKDKIVKFASARNELFYIQNDEIKIIKGDRHSVGYKDSDINYDFTEHIIDVSIDTSLYISSDGYWDQLGGVKELCFGKKRLKAMIEKIKDEPMAEQQEEFIYTLHDYQGDMDKQDDVTVIGLKV